ncbi:uncharacterized protein LOC108651632 [Drosophila navojoa]|nr:uncharacterized protein LOC108651632 [Drosophila navojoa]
MQFEFRQQPRSMLWKIAFLIIALAGDVSCIRNGAGNDEQKHISAKLKNFFPSEPVPELGAPQAEQLSAQTSARVTNGGFRPSQMLEFTPSDVMDTTKPRYPPSYLEPNYKHQLPSSLNSLSSQHSAMDKVFAFPEDSRPQQLSSQIPTTPVVSYLDPFTQQNYRYTPTPTATPSHSHTLIATAPTPSYIQYQRERPGEQGDQAYTVQSSLLVGNHSPRPAVADEVYLKRPGYVFDESPSTLYRRPVTTPTAASSNKISYDSHDYPPPSYAAQQTSNFVPTPTQRPREDPRPSYNRQDLSGPSSSNYANNFGNYLQRPPSSSYRPQHSEYNTPTHYQYEPLPQHQHQQQPQRPGHNYYEYQIGEIPPQQRPPQYNYRPGPAPGYRPPYQPQPQPQAGGFSTLATLLSTTQQYAPQFTNLLLGGGGGSSTSSFSGSSPLGSLFGAFAGTQSAGQQSSRPPNTQLIRALENIARNDDLQCVPKVLCQMIAGQTQRGQLPGFITSPAITNFLAGFPVASPALIYGRAALLGISGGARSCVQTYERCPKNEMEIIHYLNNHRGGFFKFFSEPEEQPAVPQQSESSGGGGGGGGSLFSILSALTNGGQVTHTTPRPVARPTQRPNTDIADGIGSFFTRVLSEYMSGVEYQRRRRRRRRSLLPTEIKRSIQTDNGRLMPVDFHDEEDDLDTQTPVRFQDDDEAEAAKAHTELIGVLQFPDDQDEDWGESRRLHFKNIESDEHHDSGAVRFPDATPEAQSDSQRKVIYEFNRNAAQRKLRFPQEPSEGERQAKTLQLAEGWEAVLPNGLTEEDYGKPKRRGKRIVFRDNNEQLDDLDERFREEQQEAEERLREQQLREEQFREQQVREDRQIAPHVPHAPLNAVYESAAPPQRGARVLFPDHYEQHIRRGKILNRPTYAPSYEYNNKLEEKEQRLVVSDEHRPGSHYRLESTSNYQTSDQSHSHRQSFMNYGEYLPGNTVRFDQASDRPSYSAHYDYPNANYIGDNRYSSSYQPASTRRPQHEDNKNIYVTNSQGVTEYYIRPDGRKVYLGSR